MNQENVIPNNEGTPENVAPTGEQPAPPIEINYGRITYLSEEKGAFVELITDAAHGALRAESHESTQKVEIFVPKELIAEKKNLARDLLVQLKRVGDTIVDIEPF